MFWKEEKERKLRHGFDTRELDKDLLVNHEAEIIAQFLASSAATTTTASVFSAG